MDFSVFLIDFSIFIKQWIQICMHASQDSPALFTENVSSLGGRVSRFGTVYCMLLLCWISGTMIRNMFLATEVWNKLHRSQPSFQKDTFHSETRNSLKQQKTMKSSFMLKNKTIKKSLCYSSSWLWRFSQAWAQDKVMRLLLPWALMFGGGTDREHGGGVEVRGP